MRDLRELDRYRRVDLEKLQYGETGDETCGLFIIPPPRFKNALKVIASAGSGWDHVSVSISHRCPTWGEMDAIKRMFFKDDETCVQFHVPPSDHISVHPFCLHLWRPQFQVLPRPDAIMVG